MGPHLLKIHEIFLRKEEQGNGDHVRREFIKGNKDAWTAIMIPEQERLVMATRAMLQTVLGIDGKICGAKEVGYNRPIIELYKEVLPTAKFVLLIRNPIDVYLSLKRQSWWSPDQVTDSSMRKDISSYVRIARHWAARTKGYLEFSQNNPSLTTLVTYESISVDVCRRVFDVLDLEFDEAAVTKVLRNRIGVSKDVAEISSEEVEGIIGEASEVYRAVYGEELVYPNISR